MKQNKTKTSQRLLWVSVLLFSLSTVFAWSQQTITGNVTSEDGPLPGASIVVKGTTRGVSTDFDGNYSIEAGADDTLQFSYIGYANKEVVVGNQSLINISLVADNQLDEVVVVGYGTTKKSDLTGSVSTVNTEGLAEIPVVSVNQALTGQVAGVNISQSSGQVGGGVTIRVRGGNSLNGNNEPLFVVDGYPIINDDAAFGADDILGQENTALGTAQDNPPGALNWLNPADIESIEVLKDASATAIYGSRGANGVIIVTTKSGKKRRSSLNFSSSVGFSTLTNTDVDFLNASEYAELNNLARTANGEEITYDGSPNEIGANGREIISTAPGNLGQGTDWIDAVTQSGLTQNYSLGFTGGNEDLRYAGSISYLNQEGAIIETALERINTRLNLTADLKPWLTLSNNFNFSTEDSDNLVDSRNEGRNGPWFRAQMANPVEPIYNAAGDLNVEFTASPEFNFNNPVATAVGVKNKFRTNTFLDNLSLRAKLVDGLTLETRGSVFAKRLLRDSYYNSKLTVNGAAASGLAAKNTTTVQSLLTETFVNYNKEFGVHNISAVAGYSYQTTSSERVRLGAFGFPNDNLSNESFQSGTTLPSVTNKTEDLLSSYFARINYVLNDKYLFTFSGRADGSSKFGINNKWAYFPSGAIAWKLENEEFIRDLDVFSTLKLRASYGLTGNQGITSLQTIPLLGAINYPFGGNVQVGARPGTIGNPDLKWETTSQLNVGLNAGFNKGRYTFSIDYYDKLTKDLLQQVEIPVNSGFGSVFDNLGEISNKGLELEFSANILNDEFTWTMNGNYATNKTELVDLGLESADILRLRPPGVIAAYVGTGVALVEGETPGVFYGYERMGLWKSQQEIDSNPSLGTATVGSARFRDISGPDGIPDGEITADDETIIGDPNPDFTFGWSNSFGYKGIDLSFQVQGVIGGDIFNLYNLQGEDPNYNSNNYARTLDYFDPTSNPNGQYAAPGQDSGSQHYQSTWVEDGSFVRLRNVSLGYTMRDLKNFQSIRLYLNMVNMLTWTNYTGFDPEVNSFGQSNLFRSIDLATPPPFKTITLGVNINL